jgi:hypothetical protein
MSDFERNLNALLSHHPYLQGIADRKRDDRLEFLDTPSGFRTA